MKLLLDENLSPVLVEQLAAAYPGSTHVRDVGLKSAPDSRVWSYAAAHEFTIVTKDGDFRYRSFLVGQPPRVIWLRVGNCSTQRIANLLLTERQEIERFHSSDASFLVLGLRPG